MPSHPIVDVLNTRFGGVISSGAHAPEASSACILEVISQARGVVWSDSPQTLDMPDVRLINDAFRTDGARTLAAVRLGVALWDYPEWDAPRRIRFVTAVAIATVREILPTLLRVAGFPLHADACAAAGTIGAAAAASSAASSAAYAASSMTYKTINFIQILNECSFMKNINQD